MQLVHFINVFTIKYVVYLAADQEDTIHWLWMKNGVYTTSPAYHEEFKGPLPNFEPEKIWRSYVEPNSKIFALLVFHKHILTIDLLASEGWPYDPACQVCLSQLETILHPCKDGLFTIDLWNIVDFWSEDHINTPFLVAQHHRPFVDHACTQQLYRHHEILYRPYLQLIWNVVVTCFSFLLRLLPRFERRSSNKFPFLEK